jgi:hypothetical protein
MLTGVDETLAMIPPPPTRDVTGVVHDTLRNLTETVRQEMLRVKNANTWRLTWDQIRLDFSQQLQNMRPRLQTEGLEDRNGFRNRNGVETIDLLSSDDEEEEQHAQPMPGPVTPMKRKDLPSFSSATPTPTKPTRSPATNGDRARVSKKAKVEDDGIRYQLDQTRERLYQMSSAKLARVVNPEAVATLMLEPVKQFDTVMLQFYSKLERALTVRINEILVASLGQWHTNLLFKEAQRTVMDFLKIHFGEQRTVFGPNTYADELAGPYFHDHRYMEYHTSQFLAQFKDARFRKRKRVWQDMKQEELGRDLKPVEKTEADREPTRALLAKDPYEQEVGVVAQVRAYYELAAIRFHDSICMRVESKLFRALGESLLTELKEGLQLTDENSESPYGRINVHGLTCYSLPTLR